jgi:hypothetical protein
VLADFSQRCAQEAAADRGSTSSKRVKPQAAVSPHQLNPIAANG